MATIRSPFPAVLGVLLWSLVWISGLISSSLAKECTNIPTQPHSERAFLFEGEEADLRISVLPSYHRTTLASRSVPSSAPSNGVFSSTESRNSTLAEDLRGDDAHPVGANASSVFGTTPERRAGLRKSRAAELFDAFARRRISLDLKNAFEVHNNNNNNSADSTGVASVELVERGSESEHSPSLKEVSMHRITLAADSLHGIAQETNLQYLLMLDVDNLAWSFRVTAGLPAPGSPYGGWEVPSSELRGHFVGHFLSAAALTWASTHNEGLLEKMTHLVDALWECQDQVGTGYLSAFPAELFDRFEAIEPVWAPYYTIHKIMAGLLDQYVLVGSEKALGMLLWTAEYFLRRVETVIHKHTIERHWESLNEEVGGMNDVLYRLFMLTGDPEHLKLAHLFDKPCFLGLLALQTDGLSGFHSNTHIPLVVGAQMRFEATGDRLYAELSEYFMDIINSSHRYATGGTSVSEFWTDPNRNGDALGTENQETCTTYNMLKVARNMYRWTKDIRYADYYERTLVNGILGIQRGKEPGVMIYMLPQAPGTSKAVSYHGWGTPYNAFWCCYGTGIESFSKLGDSIYFEDNDKKQFTLHVAQFVSSNVTWDAVGLLLSQNVLPLSSGDPYLHVTFEFYDLPEGANGNEAELSLRIPSWTVASTSHVKLNGLSMGAPKPGNYFSIKKAWKAGDVLQADLQVSLALEKVQDDRKHFSSLHAILFGPYLLAGTTNGDFEVEGVNTSALSSWIVPVPASYSAQLYTFSQDWSSMPLPATPEGFRNHASVLSFGNSSALMQSVPAEGTNEAAQSTFRLINLSAGPPDANSLVGQLVSFELFSRPGSVLTHTGVNGRVVATDREGGRLGRSLGESGVFKVLPGLCGDADAVSFEVATMEGCFVASDVDKSVRIQCRSNPQGWDPDFDRKASFRFSRGLASYNPVSFFAKGTNRQYLLFPLHAFLDETYATYFNLTSSA